MAFHWSVAQFTPATMHVTPTNVSERTYAIGVVVFGLVGFSYVVGSISGSLAQLRSMQEDATKQFWTLRRYLKQNSVKHPLQVRITRYLEHAWANSQKHKSVKCVPIFRLLSEQLISELQCEMYSKHLHIHPLFKQIDKESSVSMHRLANSAISERQLARRDSLFIHNEIATHMYIVIAGELAYVRVVRRIEDDEDITKDEIVSEGEDWIAEPVLWMESWTHLGGLIAVVECDLLLVSPSQFASVIAKNPIAYHRAMTYARNFSDWINQVSADELSDIWQGDNTHVYQRHIRFMDIADSADKDSVFDSLDRKASGSIFRKATLLQDKSRSWWQSFTQTFGSWCGTNQTSSSKIRALPKDGAG